MVFETLIGWLAPLQCLACSAEGIVLCQLCATSEILPFGEKCWSCGKLSVRAQTCQHCKRQGSPNFLWITTDYEALARELIRSYKFKHSRAAAIPLANLMTETFLSFNSDEHIKYKKYLVTALPTASARVRQRGFDHSALLAKKVAEVLKLDYDVSLRRHGQSRQTGAKRTERLAQIRGSFTVRSSASVRGRNILLIDDVITTGASLSEAARTLRKAGARSVDALVFAKRL